MFAGVPVPSVGRFYARHAAGIGCRWRSCRDGPDRRSRRRAGGRFPSAGLIQAAGRMRPLRREESVAFIRRAAADHGANRDHRIPLPSERSPIKNRDPGQKRYTGYVLPAIIGGEAALRGWLETKLGALAMLTIERVKAKDSTAARAMFARIGHNTTDRNHKAAGGLPRDAESD